MALLACLASLSLANTASAADPIVTTLPVDDPTLITDTYAFVGGIVNPNGIPVVYRFDYGETTAYGSSTPVTSAGNGKADVNVDVSFDDLKPNTTYHYRLVAYPDPTQGYYGVAQTAGEDQSFTTAPAPAIAFASKKAKVKGKKAQVKLNAVGPAGDSYKGKLTLTAKLGKKVKKIGRAGFKIASGAGKTIEVRLSKTARKAFAKGDLKKVRATANAKGRTADATTKLTLVG